MSQSARINGWVDKRPVRDDIHARFLAIKAKAEAEIREMIAAYCQAQDVDKALPWKDDEGM